MVDWKQLFEDLLSLSVEVKQHNTKEFMDYWNSKIGEYKLIFLTEDSGE